MIFGLWLEADFLIVSASAVAAQPSPVSAVNRRKDRMAHSFLLDGLGLVAGQRGDERPDRHERALHSVPARPSMTWDAWVPAV
jgi:hypothetical protein